MFKWILFCHFLKLFIITLLFGARECCTFAAVSKCAAQLLQWTFAAVSKCTTQLLRWTFAAVSKCAAVIVVDICSCKCAAQLLRWTFAAVSKCAAQLL